LAKKKVTNPLAGTYTGTITEADGAHQFSFTIARSGAVLGFAPTIVLGNANPDPGQSPVFGPNGIGYYPCPGIATATLSAPNLRLTKPVPGFPKGKKIQYEGPGGSPPGMVEITGAPQFGAGNRFTGVIKGNPGNNGIKDVQAGSTTCGGGGYWQATRVGH
jgi:hypothetical protein